MIHVTCYCDIQRPLGEVADRFDVRLFEALAPRFPKLVLLRHDPIADGGEVHLVLKVGPFSQCWESVLSDVVRTDTMFQFQDDGVVLPFPFRSWRHIHSVTSLGPQACRITDDIHCTTGFSLLDKLASPFVKKMFAARAPQYVSFFEQ